MTLSNSQSSAAANHETIRDNPLLKLFGGVVAFLGIVFYFVEVSKAWFGSENFDAGIKPTPETLMVPLAIAGITLLISVGILVFIQASKWLVLPAFILPIGATVALFLLT